MKRFTETTKWEDSWFRQLPPEYKLAYLYMLDKCDAAGVVDLDRDLASFQIGVKLNWAGFLEACGKRVHILEGNHVWLTRFIEFQYKSWNKLNPDFRPHFAVFKSIEKFSLSEELSYSKVTLNLELQDKDKDKDKDKEQDKEKDKEQDKEKDKEQDKEREQKKKFDRFENFWNLVPKKVAKKDCRKHYEAAVADLKKNGTSNPHEFLQDRMRQYTASPKAQSKYAWEPRSWLRDGHYDDDPGTWQEGQNELTPNEKLAQEIQSNGQQKASDTTFSSSGTIQARLIEDSTGGSSFGVH